MNEIHDTKIEINVTRVPFRCVVCNGWGTVSNQKVTCHACGGTGFIYVDQPTEREKEYEYRQK